MLESICMKVGGETIECKCYREFIAGNHRKQKFCTYQFELKPLWDDNIWWQSISRKFSCSALTLCRMQLACDVSSSFTSLLEWPLVRHFHFPSLLFTPLCAWFFSYLLYNNFRHDSWISLIEDRGLIFPTISDRSLFIISMRHPVCDG